MFTLPNIITMFRLALMPAFVLAFLLSHFLAASLLFALASITDMLDGLAARLLRQESEFGRFLDPVVDKLTVVLALTLILWQQPALYIAFPVATIICREITVSALREWMAEVGGLVGVSSYGKFKTTAQMVSICFLIGSQDYNYFSFMQQQALWWFGVTLLYVATTLTMWSMYLYLKLAWPKLTGN